ncbi:hypothetical protein [Candidatus Mycolicibacterium alkanivorans]|uniref:Uncharacterized protein n=1 Tax=Candidatus Mycolicibacterium alkanivorans TaxID=2954114 RepID=A0ABS9YV72_9MYCO|nr:hypothetical protein [Candidatus Mycolicibacterium alkanivorans]MCI4675136.1 hypothetical protein [Candidatus Mycolicibacterium alkanivorans]
MSRIGRTPYIHRDELDRFIADRIEIGDEARRPGMGRKPAAAKATGKKEAASIATAARLRW